MKPKTTNKKTNIFLLIDFIIQEMNTKRKNDDLLIQEKNDIC